MTVQNTVINDHEAVILIGLADVGMKFAVCFGVFRNGVSYALIDCLIDPCSVWSKTKE